MLYLALVQASFGPGQSHSSILDAGWAFAKRTMTKCLHLRGFFTEGSNVCHVPVFGSQG